MSNDETEIVIPKRFANAGANYHQQNQIRECQAEGMTIEQCCNHLNIEPKCVKSFYDHFSGKTAALAAEKAEAEEPEETWEEPTKPAPKKKAAAKK